ncbi:MAG: desulfoferrodoxin family protein [Candidatus Asgardarchaeia archaeon]
MSKKVNIDIAHIIEDTSDLSEYEKIHTPIVKVPEKIESGKPFDIEIQIGDPPHPNTLEHHVVWIQTFLDNECLSRVDFLPIVALPYVKLKVVLGSTAKLRVVARCNMHGLWKIERELKVE